MDREDGKVCFNPTLTLAWMFVAASVLTALAAFIHDDWGGMWFVVFYGGLSSVYLVLYYREKVKNWWTSSR